MSTITMLAIGFALLGVVIALRGIKGRRVGDHPHCRRCDFDLFGLAAGTERCPECGSLLSSSRATAIGQRRRRPVMIVFGSIVTFLSLGLVGVTFWGNHKQIDWQQYKPVAWLLHDARGTNTVAQSAALQELLRRHSLSKLSAEQVNTIVEAGLAEQANPAKAWVILWGDFIEQAQIAQQVSESQWQKYAQQAVTVAWLDVHMRPKLRAGDAVRLRLSGKAARVGSRSTFYACLNAPTFTVDGEKVRSGLSGHRGGMNVVAAPRGGWSMSQYRNLEEVIDRLPVGKHSAEITYQVRVTTDPSKNLPRAAAIRPPPRPPMPSATDVEAVQKWMETQRQAQEKYRRQMDVAMKARRDAIQAVWNGTTGPTFAEVKVSVPFTFELVAPGESPFTPITDESLRPQVEAALQVEEVRIVGSYMDFQYAGRRPPPVPMSFKVFIRDGEMQWPMDTPLVCMEQGSFPGLRQFIRGRVSEENRPNGPTVDLVFRPDPQAGVDAGAEVDKYWAREVVIKDVPLDDPMGEHYRRLRPGRLLN